MQAGRILGRKMAGLDRLLEEKFGVKVNKRLQKADWGARPLSADLLQYAAQDTHYLIPLRDLLEDELREKGLLELAQEDFRMACNHNGPADQERSESPSWIRMRARRDLSPQELATLKELVDWRESVARRLDRPPFKVLTDERLIAVARSNPSQLQDLIDLGFSERQLQKWAEELLAAVKRGSAKPAVQRLRRETPTAAYLKRLEGLKEWRKRVAAGMDVESDVVLPRGLLLALADRGAQDMQLVMQPSPWRLREFGDQICAVLQKAAPS